jgi:hypothetical protein
MFTERHAWHVQVNVQLMDSLGVLGVIVTRTLQQILYNHRGTVLDLVIRNETDNVVICGLRF